MVPMGGGRRGLVKLRRGCVGRTQAVGMVRLGISSDPDGSDCAVGISGCGCCRAIGPAPSADITEKNTQTHNDWGKLSFMQSRALNTRQQPITWRFDAFQIRWRCFSESHMIMSRVFWINYILWFKRQYSVILIWWDQNLNWINLNNNTIELKLHLII